MSILFVGSTPSELGGTTSPNTTTNARDPAFTPVGSVVEGIPRSASKGFVINTTPATDDLWVHFLMHTPVTMAESTNVDGHWFEAFAGTTSVMKFSYVNAALVATYPGGTTAVTSLSPNTTYTVDFRFTRAGTSHTMEYYIGGILQATYAFTSVAESVSRVAFDHLDVHDQLVTQSWYYSEFIVTDSEPTIGWRLATMSPAADGTYTQWDGNFSGVVEAGDGSTISTDVANERQSWTLGAYGGPATSSGVRAVVNNYFASSGLSNVLNMVPFVRFAGVDHDGAAFPSPNGTMKQQILDNNPQTALPWDTADFATLEVGIKSEA